MRIREQAFKHMHRTKYTNEENKQSIRFCNQTDIHRHWRTYTYGRHKQPMRINEQARKRMHTHKERHIREDHRQPMSFRKHRNTYRQANIYTWRPQATNEIPRAIRKQMHRTQTNAQPRKQVIMQDSKNYITNLSVDIKRKNSYATFFLQYAFLEFTFPSLHGVQPIFRVAEKQLRTLPRKQTF